MIRYNADDMGSGLMSSPVILYSESNQNLSSSPSLGCSMDGINLHQKNNSGAGATNVNSFISIGKMNSGSGIILIETEEDLLSREMTLEEESITVERMAD